MTERRIILRDLTITHAVLPPASVSFGPGLNLVIGASDTGKTFVFEALDFMLGAKDGLRRIPEAEGYNSVLLTIDPSHGAPFALRRAFEGGAFEAKEYGNGRSNAETATKTLSPVHSWEPDASLSAYLLELVGIGNRQVRKNAQGEKSALSFRHVAHLTTISETTIIQQSSPVFTEQATAHTAEANAFAYFLTGQDDSAIIAQESPKDRKSRLETQASLLEAILEERREELAALISEPQDLVSQTARIDAAIEDATGVVVSAQQEITDLEERRRQLRNEQVSKQSRLSFLEEQLKRFRLLHEYYHTDQARLKAVIEASRAFHELPQGTCPLCKHPYERSDGAAPEHSEFEAACAKEVEKIDTLRRDLTAVIAEFGEEESGIRDRIVELAASMRELENKLQGVLVPRSRSAQGELQRLLRGRTIVTQGATLQESIRDLEERLTEVRSAQAARVVKPTFQARTTTSSASEFCSMVEEILREWKYPALGPVAFDTESNDLVIGGKDRANTGKGFRAITHAAFTIGLMRYCRKKGFPHPGFVILDTPVNPYKGPVPSTAADNLSGDVKAAFFRSLADDQSGDQIIVMENEEPPRDVLDRVTNYVFTRNHAIGRYGFFPPRST